MMTSSHKTIKGKKHRMLLQPQGIFTQGDGEVMFNLALRVKADSGKGTAGAKASRGKGS